MTAKFINRRDAGEKLAEALKSWKGREDAIILALPRGGAAVGAGIAEALDLPMDLMLVRKLGAPGDEELAMGAIAVGGVCIWNEDILRLVNPPRARLEEVIARESGELRRRNEAYRGGRPAPDLNGRAVILVDDGMATGADMRAAVRAARQLGASHVTVAVPVSSDTAYEAVSREADDMAILHVPDFFTGVGSFYEDFTQMSDDEVTEIMAGLKKRG